MSTGYGRTVWALTGYQSGRFASGRAALIQSLYFRFTTPRGMLQGDDESDVYGIDMCELIGTFGTRTSYTALPGMLRNEALKDDRVADAQVTATVDQGLNGQDSLTFDIVVTPADDSGDFAFTVQASAAGAVVIGGVQ